MNYLKMNDHDKPRWAENISPEKLISYLDFVNKKRLKAFVKMSSKILKMEAYNINGEGHCIEGDYTVAFEVKNLVLYRVDGKVFRKMEWGNITSLKSELTDGNSKLQLTCMHTGKRWLLTLNEETSPKGIEEKFQCAKSEAISSSSPEFSPDSDS